MDNTFIDVFSEYVDQLVQAGRYASRDQAATAIMQSHAAQELMRSELRDSIEAAITRGGAHTSEEVAARLRQSYEEAKRQGF